MRAFTGGALLVAGAVVAISACGQDYAAVMPDAGADGGGNGPTSAEASGIDGGVVPGPILDDTYREGSRLKPNFLAVGSTRLFVDWWDTTLSVHCTFQASPAGDYRCVPRVPKAVAVMGTFTNSACSRQLLRTTAGTCATAPTLVDLGDDCAPRVVHVTGTAANAFTVGSQGCAKNNNDPPSNSYGQLADLAESEMARGTIEDGPEDLGGVLKAQYVRGDDGAYGFHRLTPKAFSTACTMSPGADGALHCVPTTALTQKLAFFADAACTSPLFTTTACSSTVGRALVASTDACEPASTPGDLYTLDGPAPSGKKSYRRSGASCEETGAETGTPGGRKLDPAVDLGTATRMQAEADGGLAVVYALLPTGHRTKIGWYDPLYAADCAFGLASDGQWHCIPAAAAPIQTVYGDERCGGARQAAYVAPTGVTQCRFSGSFFPGSGPSCPSRCTLPPTPKLAFLDAAPSACIAGAVPRRIFKVGARSEGYSATGGFPAFPTSCTLLSRSDEAVYDATELPATELVKAIPTYP